MGDYTMDGYTLQSYFKILCESFGMAYEQLQKIEKAKKKIEEMNPEDETELKKLSLPNRFWLDKFWADADRIDSIIRTIHSKGFTIAVTDSKEVLALMQFFRSNSLDRYRIINMDKDIIESFPKDERSYEFLRVYCSAEHEYLKKLLDKVF